MMHSKPLSICAVIAVRNEYPYMSVLLPLLAAQKIDVVILDNDSSDGCIKLYQKFHYAPVIAVETLPYTGDFSLTDQLHKKEEIISRLHHDWVVHHDADEVLQHREGGTLRDAIEEADGLGFNALNFEEFVFLPKPGEDLSGRDYYKEMLRYYFFSPDTNRLNRAWKRLDNLSQMSGGHILSGETVKMNPCSHILRHYIVLSSRHALSKYLSREFDDFDLKKGWHGNRINFTFENLTIPEDHELLHSLTSCQSMNFDRTKATEKHYWEWSKKNRGLIMEQAQPDSFSLKKLFAFFVGSLLLVVADLQPNTAFIGSI